MKIANLRPLITNNRVQFRLSEEYRVPEISGCYVLASIEDDVIYIGESVNLNRRMQEHLADPRMNQRTSFGLANWFYYQQYPKEEISNTETLLLFNHKAIEGRLPPLNRIGP